MPSAPHPRRMLVPTLALLTTVTAVVSSLGAPLVPSVATEYGVRLTTAQWSLTATLLVGATATPVVGRFASGRLRRPAILAGLAVVVLGTLLAAVSRLVETHLGFGFEALVVGRTLQGLGMALLPLAIAVARDELTGQPMVRAVAFLSVTAVAGAGLGYPLTAVVAQLGGLPAAYLLGTALLTATLGMAWLHLPASDESATAPVDWAGAVLLSGGVLLVLLAVTQGEVWGWAAPATLGLAAVGIAALAAWVRWSLVRPGPLVDLRLATRPGVAAPNLLALVAGIGMYSLLTLSVVLVRADAPGFGLDRSVVVAGLILVPYSLLSVLGNRWAQAVQRRAGAGALLPLGCGMFLAATLSLALFHDTLWQVLLALGLGGAGSGFTFSSLAVLMVPHVPRAETASAVAFNQVLRYLGFTTGSAVGPALMAVLGGGAGGFEGALGVMCLLWALAAVAVAVLGRRPGTPAP